MQMHQIQRLAFVSALLVQFGAAGCATMQRAKTATPHAQICTLRPVLKACPGEPVAFEFCENHVASVYADGHKEIENLEGFDIVGPDRKCVAPDDNHRLPK
ncbi:MAG: hypothetical protein ACXWVJ_00645 [Caulobacteraceae bacterium]